MRECKSGRIGHGSVRAPITGASRLRGWAALVSAVVLSACGGGGGGGGSDTPPPPPPAPDIGQYYPMAVDNRWAYSVEDANGDQYWVDRIRSATTVDGEAAFRIETYSQTGVLDGTQTLGLRRDGLWRYPAANADDLTRGLGPQRMLGASDRPGDSFVQFDKTLQIDADQDGRLDRLTVKSVVTVVGLETVTVPAGTFERTLHTRTDLTQTLVRAVDGTSYTATAETHDWYAPGVGPVRTRYEVREGNQSAASAFVLRAYRAGDRRSESVAPTVTSLSPTQGAFVGTTSLTVRATFSEAMDPGSLRDAFQLKDPQGRAVAGVTQINGKVITFLPTSMAPWVSGEYTGTLAPGVTDLAGNPVAGDIRWRFTVDADGPGIVSVTPADRADDVALTAPIIVTFNETIDPASVNDNAVQLRDQVTFTAVPVSLELTGKVLTIRPTRPLARGTAYNLLINGVTDPSGNRAPILNHRFSTSQGEFSYPVSLLEGRTTANSSAVGDVNGDGIDDVVLADSFAIRVRLGRASGVLDEPFPLSLPAAYRQVDSIAIGDVNGDGRKDLVVGTNDNGVHLILQDASGTLTFGPMVNPGGASHVRLADMNGDGRLDIISIGWGATTASIALQDASGHFPSTRNVPLGRPARDFEVADLNGDGRPDLVVIGSSNDGTALSLHLQRPDGSFGPAIDRRGPHPPAFGSAAGIAVGDLNGDGRLDVAVTFSSNQPAVLGVYLQGADGQLGDFSPVPTYDLASSVRIADMNGDGRADLVVHHYGWSAVGVYTQRPDGTLSPEVRYVGPYGTNGPHTMTLADVNRDGRMDIIAGMQLLLALPPAPQVTAARPGAAEAARRMLTRPRR